MKHLTRYLAILAVLAISFVPYSVSAAQQRVDHTVTSSAWVNNATPEQNTKVIAFAQILIDGVGRKGIPITFTWSFKTVTQTCSSTTNDSGIAACGRYIGMATANRTVPVTASFRAYGANYSASTSFVTQAAKSTPPPLPPIDGGGSGGGGGCLPNYSVCTYAGIGDYDCAGGSGNGPNYVRGPFQVLTSDIFGLDSDNDGVACEGG